MDGMEGANYQAMITTLSLETRHFLVSELVKAVFAGCKTNRAVLTAYLTYLYMSK